MLGLNRLTHLDASNNSIYRLDDITVLQTCVPQLTLLSLACCPITDAKSYAQTVLAKLPALTFLDGNVVGDTERQQAQNSSTSISIPMIKAAALSSSGSRVWPRVTSASGGRAGDGSAEIPEDAKFLEVDSLDLGHRWIKRLSNLSGLVQLRKASFNDNEITKIEGLSRLTVLEELSLEENRIASLEGVDTLKSLRKLDVGKNVLTSVRSCVCVCVCEAESDGILG